MDFQPPPSPSPSPASPWMGGVWESFVKSVRSRLKDLTFKEKCLQTFVFEVESVLSGCRLTSIRLLTSDFKPFTPNYLLIGEASPRVLEISSFLWSKLRKEVEISSGCNRNVLELMAMKVFSHFSSLRKMDLGIVQLQGWRPCKSNDERYALVALANGKSFRDVWSFEWCSSCHEIEHNIG